MIRKPKTLGLMLAAAALSLAFMASAAQAQFTSNKTHTIYSGSQEGTHKFTAGAGIGSITCTTASFTGTATTTNESSLSITPTWSGCKDSLGRTVHVVKNTMTWTELPSGVIDQHGELVTTVTGSTHCTITIKAQKGTNGITRHTLGGTSGWKKTTNSTNIKSEISGGFFACGTSATKSENGTYEGTTVMTGKDTTGAAAEISVD